MGREYSIDVVARERSHAGGHQIPDQPDLVHVAATVAAAIEALRRPPLRRFKIQRGPSHKLIETGLIDPYGGSVDQHGVGRQTQRTEPAAGRESRRAGETQQQFRRQGKPDGPVLEPHPQRWTVAALGNGVHGGAATLRHSSQISAPVERGHESGMNERGGRLHTRPEMHHHPTSLGQLRP